MMLEIINNIPDKMRVVIYMHFYSKMSVSDIAEELGISEGTVKSRIYYGKKHIKEQVLAYEKDGIKLYNADILDILEKLISDIAKISEFPTSFNVSAVTDAITSSTLFKLGFSAAANTSVNAVNSSFSAKISIAAAAIAIAVGGFAMIYIPKIPANASNEISSDSESSYTDSDNKGQDIPNRLNPEHNANTEIINNTSESPTAFDNSSAADTTDTADTTDAENSSDPVIIHDTSTVYETSVLIPEPVTEVSVVEKIVEKVIDNSNIDPEKYHDVSDGIFTYRIYDDLKKAVVISADFPDYDQINSNTKSSLVSMYSLYNNLYGYGKNPASLLQINFDNSAFDKSEEGLTENFTADTNPLLSDNNPFLYNGIKDEIIDEYDVIAEDPIEEDPIEEDPIEEDPIEEDPIEEDPVEEDPIEEDPVEEDPIEEDPVEEDPIEEDPVEEDPVEEDPVEEDPIEEDLIEEDPIEEDVYEYDVDQAYTANTDDIFQMTVKNHLDTINTKSANSQTSYTVPGEIEGIPVTEIGDKAFSSAAVSCITIPDSITKIDSNAFYSSSVSRIVLSKNITEIGDYAFYDCKNLTEIALPDNIQKIGDYAFASSGLKNIKLPLSLEFLGSNAFYDSAVQAIDITYNNKINYDNINSSYHQYFNTNTKICLTIPDGTDLNSNDYFTQFLYPYFLNPLNILQDPAVTKDTVDSSYSVILNGNIDYIKTDILSRAQKIQFNDQNRIERIQCNALSNVYLQSLIDSHSDNCDNGALYIGKSLYALYDSNCIADGVLTVKKGTVSVSDITKHYVFNDVNLSDNIRKLVISSDVRYIDCGRLSSLEAYEVAPDNPYFCSVDGLLYNKDMTELIDIPANWHREHFTLPSTVKTVTLYGYSYVNDFDAVSIKIPYDYMATGNGFSSAYRNIKHLIIAENANPYDLDAATEICGTNSPGLAMPLESIVVEDGNPLYTVKDGILYTAPTGKYLLKSTTAAAGNITISDQTASICPYAFSGCKNISSFTLPDNSLKIGASAFADCTGIREINLFKNTKLQISYDNPTSNIFNGCISLNAINVSNENEILSSSDGILYDKIQTVLLRCPESYSGIVSIPDSVYVISDGAFNNCGNVTEIIVAKNVNDISADMSSLKNLERFTVADDNPYFSEENGVLYNKDKTVLYKIPSQFKGTYTLPKTVQSISKDCFKNCSELTEIVLPKELKDLDSSYFDGCGKLTKIKYR